MITNSFTLLVKPRLRERGMCEDSREEIKVIMK